MKYPLALLAISAAVIALAWTAQSVVDALIGAALASSAGVWMGVGVVAVGAVVGLVALSRRAYRQVERDFPRSSNDRRE